MVSVGKKYWLVVLAAMLSLAVPFSLKAGTDTPEQLLQQLNDYPHAQEVAAAELEVLDHEIGLGAMQKSRGAWQFKTSERLSGHLSRHTWQIVDGFTSIEVMEELIAELEAAEGSRLLFTCDGRACGSSVQWANRVFGQRVLYGRADLQYYRVYALEAGTGYRLAIYSAARTADRQYLHVDLLRLAD